MNQILVAASLVGMVAIEVLRQDFEGIFKGQCGFMFTRYSEF